MEMDIDEKLSKPLGIGFDDVWTFLHEYIRPDRSEGSATPDLTFSLGHVDLIPQIGEMVRRVGDDPVCLIEGCTSPTNGRALDRFLRRHGATRPTVHAIDLIDVKSIFAEHGIDMPDMAFHVADARDLSGLFSAGSVDVVAQDFLLNCAPYATHSPIMREANRVMGPESVAFVCFTDHRGPANESMITYDEFEMKYLVPFKESAFSLRDIVTGRDDDGLLQRMRRDLAGKVIADEAQGRYTLVTGAGGNFEFYRPFDAFERLFAQAGLMIEGLEESSGRDRNDNLCFRYRAVLRKGD
ncbi:MAG: class I SAM-dependent methyltransferase [Nanoarchaeota archaeon]